MQLESVEPALSAFAFLSPALNGLMVMSPLYVAGYKWR